MSAEGYSGYGSFIFFIDEIGGYGTGGYGGSLTVPVNPDAQDTHIPLNNLTEISFDLPKYTIYEEVLIGDSIPTRQSKMLELGKLSLSCGYHAPFLMSRFFTTVTTDGAWSTATESVTMNLTDWETTTNSMAIHMHIENRTSGSDDIDLNVFGGEITSYSWGVESDGILTEEVELEFNQTATGAIAYNSASTYHNQKFALWNTDRIINSNEVKLITQQKVTVTTTTTIDSAIASYTAAKITLKSEYAGEPGIGYEQKNFSGKKSYDIEATMTVKPKDNLMIEQILSRIEDRLRVPFKMLITEGTRSEYIQCTEMRLHTIGPVSIPSAKGDAVLQQELTFVATAESVVTYVGTFNAAGTVADPSTYIKGL